MHKWLRFYAVLKHNNSRYARYILRNQPVDQRSPKTKGTFIVTTTTIGRGLKATPTNLLRRPLSIGHLAVHLNKEAFLVSVRNAR